MTSKAATVSEYLHHLPAERRAALSKLRALIQTVAPDTSEEMKHGMPVFGDFCAFASQKHYMAFYAHVAVVDAHRQKLGKLSCGKCCIRFKRLEDLPLDIIESILKDTVKRRKQGIGA